MPPTKLAATLSGAQGGSRERTRSGWIATDIAKQKPAARDTSDARFRVMTETAPVILFTADQSSRWDYANQRFLDFTGRSADATDGLRWSEIVHPDDLVRINAALDRSAKRGEPFELDLRLRSAEGGYSWFLMRGRPMRDAQGRVERWFGAALEIDQLKHAEHQLRCTNQNLKGILASISDFYYTLDHQLCLTAINPQAAAFAGVQPRQVLGRCILDVFPGLKGSALEAAYRKSLSRRVSVHLGCSAVMRPGRRLDIDIYPLEAGLSVFSRDVTERKRAEHEVRELGGRVLRAQDEERRRIARELHDGAAQNMAAVAANLQRLCEMRAGGGGAQRLARESLGLIDETLSEIRTLSYLLHPPLLDEIGLAAALQWYIDGFEMRSGIKVDLRILQELDRLPSETEITLFRVVQESLVNVHRHAGSKTAAIQLGQTGTEFVLTIRDTGKGMPDVAYASAGDDIRSLGVGIAGMNARLRQLGGRLEVVSSKRGTTVRAIVPRNSARAHREASAPAT